MLSVFNTMIIMNIKEDGKESLENDFDEYPREMIEINGLLFVFSCVEYASMY